MKHILPLLTVVLIFHHTVIAQCPEPGLQILSASCESARNLGVVSINCTTLKVRWQETANQTFIIKANRTEVLTGKTYEVAAGQYTCKNGGTC